MSGSVYSWQKVLFWNNPAHPARGMGLILNNGFAVSWYPVAGSGKEVFYLYNMAGGSMPEPALPDPGAWGAVVSADIPLGNHGV